FAGRGLRCVAVVTATQGHQVFAALDWRLCWSGGLLSWSSSFFGGSLCRELLHRQKHHYWRQSHESSHEPHNVSFCLMFFQIECARFKRSDYGFWVAYGQG